MSRKRNARLPGNRRRPTIKPSSQFGSSPTLEPALPQVVTAQEFYEKGNQHMSQAHLAETPLKVNGEWSQGEMEFQDRTIPCVDCGEEFIWTAGEQVFFHDKGLKNEPKRCKPCKQAKNERLAAIAAAQAAGVRQRIEVTVNCAQCGQQTTVPFYPSQGRPVFCRSCFLAMRGPDAQSA